MLKSSLIKLIGYGTILSFVMPSVASAQAASEPLYSPNTYSENTIAIIEKVTSDRTGLQQSKF